MPQSMSQARHVFVYGTLRRGGRNDIARFDPPARFVAEASILGTLYDLGSYPGAVLDGRAPLVGEIYAITPALEAKLDHLEEVRPDGSGEYIKRDVRLQVGESEIDCLVYEIHPARIAGKGVIASGNWFDRMPPFS